MYNWEIKLTAGGDDTETSVNGVEYQHLTNSAPISPSIGADSHLSVTQKKASGGQLAQNTYAYDPHGRQLTVTDARNGTTTYAFDGADQVTSVTTPPPGTGDPAQTSSTDYDELGRPKRIVYPDGASLTNVYYLTGELKQTSGSRA